MKCYFYIYRDLTYPSEICVTNLTVVHDQHDYN